LPFVIAAAINAELIRSRDVIEGVAHHQTIFVPAMRRILVMEEAVNAAIFKIAFRVVLVWHRLDARGAVFEGHRRNFRSASGRALTVSAVGDCGGREGR
jgi:hypothetical protein